MLEIVLILLLILANGVFAMSEIAVVSSRKARLQQLSNEGNRAAKAALGLAENPNRFLSTVQIGITLVGIFAGAYGGATLAEPLAERLDDVPTLAPYADGLSLALVILLITYLSLVLGELVPKRLALTRPEAIASLVATPMSLLSKLAAPLVWLLSASTGAVLRLFRVKEGQDETVSEEEITVLLDQATQAGVFHETEQELVENVFWLGDRSAGSLMLPRRDIAWLDINATPEDIRAALKHHPYNRFVVAEGNLDKVLGFVEVRRLLSSYLDGIVPKLADLLEPPLYFPETTPALMVLERFRDTGVPFGLVLDEYGGVEGLITLNNVLETLVEDEDLQTQIVQREDGSWLLDGLWSVDEFKEQFELTTLPGEDDHDFRTLGGFVVTYLGHIPKAGETFDWGGFRFEIIDMDGHRVDKLLLERLPVEGLVDPSQEAREQRPRSRHVEGVMATLSLD
jgi:putative hemolysin